MAVSGISSSSIPSTQATNQQNPPQLFVQLIKSIQSGDLSGAQQAYSSLSQSQGSNAGDPNDPFAQAMNQIGKSLKSGDIGGAQQALATLQHELEGKHQTHHHHRHGGGSPPPAPTTVTATDGSSTTGSAIDVIA